MPKEHSKKEIIDLARQLATPIDFDELEKKGIIEKKGAWFRINDLSALPEHAAKQIRSIKTDKGNCFAQFPKSWKRAQQLYRRMTGKEYHE